MNVSDRYNGKPFLRLLECYVLRTIGELSPEDESNLDKMTPKLMEIYNVNGAWYDIVATVMDFPESLVPQIQAIWEHNQKLARARNEDLTPQDFVEVFVGQNFSNAI